MLRMNAPLFYTDTAVENGTLTLDEAAARHIRQALRMKAGDHLLLTDGLGSKMTAEIQQQEKRSCTVWVTGRENIEKQNPDITIGISPVKNTGRFEWFLEKATEIGVNAIVPLVCARTEKTHFRADRMKNILVSAMLQSRQYWLPVLQEPIAFQEWITQATAEQKWIAHCLDGAKQGLEPHGGSSLICIGPEGDFTSAEIASALQNGFKPATLGKNRLRTETAGMVAAALLRGS